jgi:hypothetical protein
MNKQHGRVRIRLRRTAALYPNPASMGDGTTGGYGFVGLHGLSPDDKAMLHGPFLVLRDGRDRRERRRQDSGARFQWRGHGVVKTRFSEVASM